MQPQLACRRGDLDSDLNLDLRGDLDLTLRSDLDLELRAPAPPRRRRARFPFCRCRRRPGKEANLLEVAEDAEEGARARRPDVGCGGAGGGGGEYGVVESAGWWRCARGEAAASGAWGWWSRRRQRGWAEHPLQGVLLLLLCTIDDVHAGHGQRRRDLLLLHDGAHSPAADQIWEGGAVEVEGGSGGRRGRTPRCCFGQGGRRSRGGEGERARRTGRVGLTGGWFAVKIALDEKLEAR